MYAQLGNIVFENQVGFLSYSNSGEIALVEHALIGRKPKLQPMGPGLEQLEISMRFHISFNIDVTQSINALINARDSFEVLQLVWGNGLVQGYFLISQLDITHEDADKDGTLFSALVSATLKEHVSNVLDDEQKKAREKALAVGDKKPVIVSKKANPLTCNQKVSKLISELESYAAQIEGIHQLYQNTLALGDLEKCKPILTTLQTMAKDSSSCAFNATLNNWAGALFKSDRFFKAAILQPNLTAIHNENSVFQYRVKLVKQSAAPIIKNSITRKN